MGEDGLTRGMLAANPIEQFECWFQEAVAAKIALPHAMTLATSTAEGVPSARTVLLKGVDEHGFVFYTNYNSQKGRELAANPRAALVFYWRELDRQVRVTGSVQRLSREASNAYFQSRPRGSQLSALASPQSEVVAHRETLEERVALLQRTYEGHAVPLPPHWGGFRLWPQMIEFWLSRTSRLHDRFRYTRQVDEAWLIERLAP